ncbi:hypothetical protein [Xanthomarina gelatinilytica]|uniref:hypothetical protein n=1 Tax=Xanthomarina gelatinilytica TaxID=1137281 RepID=UPI003AA8A76F
MFKKEVISELRLLGISEDFIEYCHTIVNDFPKTIGERKRIYRSIIDQAESLFRVVSSLDDIVERYPLMDEKLGYNRLAHFEHIRPPTRKCLLMALNEVVSCISKFDFCMTKERVVASAAYFSYSSTTREIRKFIDHAKSKEMDFGLINTHQIMDLDKVWRHLGKKITPSNVDGDYLKFLSLCLYESDSKMETIKKQLQKESKKVKGEEK